MRETKAETEGRNDGADSRKRYQECQPHIKKPPRNCKIQFPERTYKLESPPPVFAESKRPERKNITRILLKNVSSTEVKEDPTGPSKARFELQLGFSVSQ